MQISQNNFLQDMFYSQRTVLANLTISIAGVTKQKLFSQSQKCVGVINQDLISVMLSI